MSCALRPRSRLLVGLVCAFTLAFSATAGAWFFSTITDFNLNDSGWTYYNSYTISSTGDGSASYRWTDDPDHTSIITGASCYDLTQFGSGATIPAHDTTYHGMFGGGNPGMCFWLRGKLAAGAGTMNNHDGILRR